MAHPRRRLGLQRRAAAAPAAVVVLASAALLGACAAPSARPAGSRSAQPVAPSPAPAIDDDWHALVLVPFGTPLKDVPFRLGEVLEFHDATRTAAGHEDRDCYALEGTAPPRWFARPVEQYSLCFASDRLDRIEASVSLPPESAPAQFAAACSAWLNGSASGGAAADRCEGHDGATAFDARLTQSAVSGAPAVSIVLSVPASARE